MGLHIKCNNISAVFCPTCASKPNLSKDNKMGHCGHCGTQFSIEVTDKIIKAEEEPVTTKENQEAFTQLSLF